MTAQDGDWGVLVRETGVLATRGPGCDWWIGFHLHQHPDRLACLAMSIGGGEWHVACDSREDAASLRDLMIARGIHKTHVRVSSLAAARAACERKMAQARARRDRISEYARQWADSPEHRAHVELCAELPADEHGRIIRYQILGLEGWEQMVAWRAHAIREREGRGKAA